MFIKNFGFLLLLLLLTSVFQNLVTTTMSKLLFQYLLSNFGFSKLLFCVLFFNFCLYFYFLFDPSGLLYILEPISNLSFTIKVKLAMSLIF